MNIFKHFIEYKIFLQFCLTNLSIVMSTPALKILVKNQNAK